MTISALNKIKLKNVEQFNTAKEYMETSELHTKTVPKIVQCSAAISSDISRKCSIEFVNSFSEDAVINSTSNRKAVLIFASGTRHGGGVINGAIAQEEAISRTSSWTNVQVPESYLNFRGPTYGHQFLIADGFFFYDSSFNELVSPVKCKFISCAAINFNMNIEVNNSVKNMVIERMVGMLNECSVFHIDEFIIGAWGCGVFGGQIEFYAQCWTEAIDKSTFSKKIIVSIPDLNSINIFKAVIGI